MHKHRLSMGLSGLLSFHWRDFIICVDLLAESPLSSGLAWVCWATSASASVMERVAIRHAASGGSVMAPRRQAHDQGSLFHPADCAPQLAIISWAIVTFDTAGEVWKTYD
jgi:hypothetical protein